MQLIKTTRELQTLIRETKKSGQTIGLVPTMGALHEGHASLIRAACAENDFVVVSDFVNPTQFGPMEDLDAYPHTLEADCQLAEKIGASVLFAPPYKEMYPSQDMTWIEVTGEMTRVLCGRSRPIHFRGVTTVVGKLFHLTQPDKAYFGQKDAQQVQIIKRMVRDLFFPLEIRVIPIVREADGLAKSSRNIYLKPEEREAALVLSQALKEVQQLFAAGERSSKVLLNRTRSLIIQEPMSDIDYVAIHLLPGLEEAESMIVHPHLLAAAVRFGTTRLIDNVILDPEKKQS